VDSLVLEELSDGDKELLESSLKKFHEAQNDTSRINVLGTICENMIHEDWDKYQFFQYDLIQEALKSNPSKSNNKSLNISMASALNNIGLIYQDQGDIPKALEYYHKSLKIQEEIGNKEGIANGINNIGFAYVNQGEILKGIEYHHKSLKIQEEIGNKEGIATSLNNIGFIYDQQGDISMALEYYHKSLKIREKIANKEGVAASLHNIGVIYKHQGDISKALQCLKKSLKIYEEIDDNYGIAYALNSIGGIYGIQGDNSEALHYFEKCLKIRRKIGHKEGMSISLNNIGVIYKNQGDISKALEYYNESLKIKEEIGDKNGVAVILINIGAIELMKGKAGLLSAEESSQKALDLAREIGYPDRISDASNLLSQVYENQGKGIKALEMYKLHVQMKDSINNEETHKATIRAQTKYEFEKAQIVKENKAKEEARILEEETSRRNNLQYSLIFLGILVLFGIVLSLGFIKVSPNIAEGLIFFAFLILFEFVLVFSEPYLEQYTNDEPMYNLLANSVLALVIFPLHAVLEKLLKKRIVK